MQHTLGSVRLVTLLACLILGVTGCNSSDSPDDPANEPVPATATAAGNAQKGPFQPGGTAAVFQLQADGSRGEGSIAGDITSNGSYSLAGIDWTGPTQLEMTGPFFNEFTGNFTMGDGGKATLHGLAAFPDEAPANVNLFTHFVAARVQTLMASETGFADARDQARGELAAIMDIDAAPSTLDLLHDEGDAAHEDDSANLLLFSAARLAAGVNHAGDNAIAADFADDGQINGGGQAAFDAIKQATVDHPDLLVTARTNLQNQYGVTPPNDTDGQAPAWVPGTPAGSVAAFTTSGPLKTGEAQAFDAGDSTGDGLSYAWGFGDGDTASGAQTTHVFTDADDYTVTLTITDGDNRTDTATRQLTITEGNVLPAPPEADFIVSGDRTEGNDLDFNAGDATGASLSYAWNFDDGNTATGAQTTYAFADAGNYTVTLTVTDSAGQNDTATRTLTIAAAGPQAAFTISGPATAQQAQSFDATDSTGSDLTYYWTFGDGDAGRSARIPHVYDRAGDYTIKLTVTDGDNNSDSTSQSLTVAAAPQPVAGDGMIDGSVIDTDNSPLEGVQVRLVNAQDLVGADRGATTDTDGKTTLGNMPTGVEFVLELTKDGYADRYVRTTIPAGASDAATFAATMTARAAAQTLRNAENGGSVTGTDGTAIELPAGALVDASGNPVSGDVEVALTPVDVSDANARDAFPGSFAAADENGDSGLLLSFGVAEYNLTQNGERLQIAPGKQATLTVPIYIDTYSDGSAVKAGDSIPLWSLDETTGQWAQEGMGTVVADSNSPTGLGFEMVVGHLSWYNCDAFNPPYRPIPHCKIANSSGLPALDISETCFITGHTVGDGPYSSTSTNIRGDNSSPLRVPADVDYLLVAAARNGTLTGQITVSGAADDEQDVSIVLSAGAGNGEAITLPYDEDGIIGAVDEPDLYRFTGQAGQFIGVQAGPTSSGSSLRGKLHLTTASGQAVDTVISSDSFNRSRNGVLMAKLPANGEYLVKAQATSGTPGDYWLDVRTVPSVDIDENIQGTLRHGGGSMMRTFQGTAGTVVGVTNTASDSAGFSVYALDGNVIFGKSYSSSSDGKNGRGELPADGTYVVRMSGRSSQPIPYKTAVARIELPQPLTFDSAGRATATGDIQVYGDHQYYSFTAARGDGIFARLETDGPDGLTSAGALVSLYVPREDDPLPEAMTRSYYSATDQSPSYVGESVLPVLSSTGAKLTGSNGGQTYLLAVFTDKVKDSNGNELTGSELGDYKLRLDVVPAGSDIVIDDDLVQCPTAHGHSVRAAAYAIEAGGTIDVCAGNYAEQLPIYNRYQTGFTISGRSRSNVLLENERGGLIVNNPYDERVNLESVTLVGVRSKHTSGLARGVAINNVTASGSKGPSSEDLGALRLGDGATVDGLEMNAGKVAVIAEGDDITIRNSTFIGSAGRIEWDGDNAVFENNAVQAAGDDADGDFYQFSIKGTGAQVTDNTFTVTGTQNAARPAINILYTGSPYSGGANASPTVVRGNTLTTSTGGLAVADFDVAVERNFVKLTSDGGGQTFNLAAPTNVKASDTVAALVRNNVFDGLKDSPSSQPRFASVQIVRPGTFTDIDIINNTWRVTQGDPFCKCDLFMFAIGRSDDPLSGVLPMRLINNIFVGPRRDEVDPEDDFYRAIWVPENATIDANNNLFYRIDTAYDGGSTRTGSNDIAANPMFINGLLEVSDAAPGVDNGQGPMAGGPPIPDVDYDGTQRPQNSGYDIGAHENDF